MDRPPETSARSEPTVSGSHHRSRLVLDLPPGIAPGALARDHSAANTDEAESRGKAIQWSAALRREQKLSLLSDARYHSSVPALLPPLLSMRHSRAAAAAADAAADASAARGYNGGNFNPSEVVAVPMRCSAVAPPLLPRCCRRRCRLLNCSC